jgi:hypothetical protein
MKLFQSDKEKFEDEVTRLARVMGLFLWTIKIQWEEDLGDSWGEASPTDGAQSGIITFENSLLKEPWRTQQTIVLHELLHLVHHDLTESLYSSIQKLDIAQTQKDLLWGSFRSRAERFVDQLSRVLQPLI